MIFGGWPVIFEFISIPRPMTLAALHRGRVCQELKLGWKTLSHPEMSLVITL
jgi:hypothetical protein